MADLNQEESMEYIIFTVTTKAGEEVEMAVVDEFEYDGKNYVATGKVVGDAIDEEGVYIYRVKAGEEFDAEPIEDMKEYEAVVKAYMEM